MADLLDTIGDLVCHFDRRAKVLYDERWFRIKGDHNRIEEYDDNYTDTLFATRLSTSNSSHHTKSTRT
jgi:hypothetical protein